MVSFAVDVNVGGEFVLGYTATKEASHGAMPKIELNVDSTIDENTKVSMELDCEGDDFDSLNVSLDDFRLSSNILAALGLESPVSLELTVGYYDAFFKNWNYVSRAGVEHYYSQPNLTALCLACPSAGETSGDIKIGFGDFALHYWNDFDFENMLAGVSGTVADFNFFASYGAPFKAAGEGYFWIDAGYSLNAGPVDLYLPAMFTYNTANEELDAYGWSSGIAADVDMVHASVGIGGVESSAIKNIIPEVSIAPVEGSDIFAIGYLDASADSVYQSIDVGASYKVGAMTLGLGGVIAADDTVYTALWSDTFSMNGSGFYMVFDVDF